MAEREYPVRRPSASNALQVKTTYSNTPLDRMYEAIELGRRVRAIAQYLRHGSSSDRAPDPTR